MELQAKKSLGQHFLKSPQALRSIIDAANIQPGEKILEIGPGTGILTDELLKTEASVIAIEKDDRAHELLKEKYARECAAGRLSLIRDDVLELDRTSLGLEEGNYALVANIPYYITGAILEMFLEHAPRPSRMVLLVQKEVAERIVARDEKESILSISVKMFGSPRIVAKVPRGAFVPPPNVDSAIIEIRDISATQFSQKNLEIRRFFEILKLGFAHKRKYLARNLEEAFPTEKISQAWQKVGLDMRIRAEDVRPEIWPELARALCV